jgi:3-oxoacyl-[acyl-carrier-protein] synthase-3
MLPRMFFSRPATILPETAVDNETALARLRESFRGTAGEWEHIEQGVRWVFDRCNTKLRYLEADDTLSPGEFASRAAAACCCAWARCGASRRAPR